MTSDDQVDDMENKYEGEEFMEDDDMEDEQ